MLLDPSKSPLFQFQNNNNQFIYIMHKFLVCCNREIILKKEYICISYLTNYISLMHNSSINWFQQMSKALLRMFKYIHNLSYCIYIFRMNSCKLTDEQIMHLHKLDFQFPKSRYYLWRHSKVFKSSQYN